MFQDAGSSDPSKSLMYQTLVDTGQQYIKEEEKKGIIWTETARWDATDEAEFDSVPLEVLLDDPYFGGGDLWPVHRQDILDLWAAHRTYGVHTFIDIAGIGSGKTFKLREILRIMVLKVITKVNPSEYYGQAPSGKGIAFVCMSRNAQLAREVTFKTILPAFNCPFFNQYFPPQVDFHKMEETKSLPALLRFPKNITIFPGTGSALSALGYDVFGGGIDEANYLEVIDESKRALLGARYDAAEEMYNAIMARMRSRFVRPGGRLPGMLMLLSNPRYSGDFLERMARRAVRDRQIFVRRRCSWEAQPQTRFCGRTFKFDVVNRTFVDPVEAERTYEDAQARYAKDT